MKLSSQLSTNKRKTLLSLTNNARLNNKIKGGKGNIFGQKKSDTTQPITIADSLEFDNIVLDKLNLCKAVDDAQSLQEGYSGRNIYFDKFRSRSNKNSFKDGQLPTAINFKPRINPKETERGDLSVVKRNSVEDARRRFLFVSPPKFRHAKALQSHVYPVRRLRGFKSNLSQPEIKSNVLSPQNETVRNRESKLNDSLVVVEDNDRNNIFSLEVNLESGRKYNFSRDLNYK